MPRVKPDQRALRRAFFATLLVGLKVVWPVLSIVIGTIFTLGLLAGYLEGWSFHESVYFSFVTGLTIGYGDFAPKTLLTRMLAVLIGMCGVVLTAVIAAVVVRALTANLGEEK